jgi:Etoposide-induced protein 2.4 (EI24)
MNMLIDSFWRAAVYCLHPRVMLLSLLPLVLIVAVTGGLGWLYWDAAVAGLRNWLDASSWLQVVWRWFEAVGLGSLKSVVAPLMVIFSVTPMVVLATLLVVSFFMTPALTRLVAQRRFPQLLRKQGGTAWQGLFWTGLSVLLALGALLITLPMWLVPPLAMVLPALIWGWLTYRVMAYDVLAEFASAQERRTLMARHRLPWLGMGVATGLMGAAPSLVWASGALFAAAFVILVPVAIWIYTLVFAFSSLWFAHFALAALQALRDESGHGVAQEVWPAGMAPNAAPHSATRLAALPDITAGPAGHLHREA